MMVYILLEKCDLELVVRLRERFQTERRQITEIVTTCIQSHHFCCDCNSM